MNKLQKIEFASIITFVIAFIVFMIESLRGMELFGESTISSLGVFSGICFFISILVFLVAYVIKIIKEKNKFNRFLWCFFPIIAILFSVLFVDGVLGFDSEFFFLNIICVILEFIMVVLYNLFISNYYGEDKQMTITLFLYNIVVLLCSICGTGISYIHHYYIGFLFIAIVFGYIELIIRNVLAKKKC